MKEMFLRVTAYFLIIWFPAFIALPAFAQNEDDGETISSDDGADNSLFGPDINEDAVISEDKDVVSPPAVESGDDNGSAFDLADQPVVGAKDDRKSIVQNAVLEGLQISKEPGDTPDEEVITTYFIFRDKPTSYFYEAKPKQKTIVFEFNDVELGASPIPSQKEPPIQGFRMTTEKVDANKEVVGLTPEWHDILKVSFFFDAIPEITVKDEYSVISYSFRWSTNPEKQKALVQEEGGNKALLLTLLGGGLALGGVGAYLLLKPDPPDEEKQPLSTIWDDNIVHPKP